MTGRKQKNITELLAIRQTLRERQPLIHCITNHISISDCANAVLAVYARPIMAEHPAEAAEITATAAALAVNLGNISDSRMEAMRVSGEAAGRRGIPCAMDLVGVGCSRLRLDFARRFIADFHPAVIKGNLSECKALAGVKNSAKGIDAGDADRVTESTLAENAELLRRLAAETGAVVAATGALDLVAGGNDVYVIENGCELLSRITGTGCMLNALTASFIAFGDILSGTLLAVCYLGVCGELAYTEKGPGSFKVALLDQLHTVSDAELTKRIRCTLYEQEERHG